MNKFAMIIIAKLVLGGAVAAQSPANSSAELEGLEGKNAPKFVIAAMDNTEFNSENSTGKVVVMNLWATFCEPCITEMPELNSLTLKYKGKNVVFLAPTPEPKDLLAGFFAKHEFLYKVLPKAFDVVQNYAPKKKSGIEGQPGSFIMMLPTHLIIDQNGKVFKHFWGYSPETADKISSALDELLGGEEN